MNLKKIIYSSTNNINFDFKKLKEVSLSQDIIDIMESTDEIDVEEDTSITTNKIIIKTKSKPTTNSISASSDDKEQPKAKAKSKAKAKAKAAPKEKVKKIKKTESDVEEEEETETEKKPKVKKQPATKKTKSTEDNNADINDFKRDMNFLINHIYKIIQIHTIDSIDKQTFIIDNIDKSLSTLKDNMDNLIKKDSKFINGIKIFPLIYIYNIFSNYNNNTREIKFDINDNNIDNSVNMLLLMLEMIGINKYDYIVDNYINVHLEECMYVDNSNIYTNTIKDTTIFNKNIFKGLLKVITSILNSLILKETLKSINYINLIEEIKLSFITTRSSFIKTTPEEMLSYMPIFNVLGLINKSEDVKKTTFNRLLEIKDK